MNSTEKSIFGMLARAALGIERPLQVCRSAAGYYIGTLDEGGLPESRESWEYFGTRRDAERALDSGAWTQRSSP